MSAPTKKRPTRRIKKGKKNEKNTPWREAFARDIRKYSEGGLMLKGCRAKEEITQKVLADAIGVSQHHISEMENGKRPIGKEMAKKFADYFEVDYRIFL